MEYFLFLLTKGKSQTRCCVWCTFHPRINFWHSFAYSLTVHLRFQVKQEMGFEWALSYYRFECKDEGSFPDRQSKPDFVDWFHSQVCL